MNLISRLIKFNRTLSWILVILALITIITGYSDTRHFFTYLSPLWFLTREIHLWFNWFFIALFAFHVFVIEVFVRFKWASILRHIRNRKRGSFLWLKLIQKVSGYALLVLSLLIIVSGLNWYIVDIGQFLPLSQHVRLDLYMITALIVHIALGGKMALTRRRIKGRLANISIVAVTIFFILIAFSVDSNLLITDRFPTPIPTQTPTPTPTLPTPTPIPTPTPHEDTVPTMEGKVKVDRQELTFDPAEVETVRPDLFNPGFFSMFDVLVHLDKQGLIDLEYHFDESMNTHVIDSLNGEPHWWYSAYYSGGWPECNVFRPDHYPWKDGTTLTFFKTAPSTLEDIHSVWKEEVTRRKNNGGKLIVPKVIIRGSTFSKEFENVEVTPHNVRNDVFRENVTTALDVIMSLGDQGKITYELEWYESIGTANIVKNYWVEAINGDSRIGRCGFVYEAGSFKYTFFRGNHIHLPTDSRILNSPEYVEFFWICV